MSVDALAHVIDDLRKGRAIDVANSDSFGVRLLLPLRGNGPVVDCTGVYQHVREQSGSDIYRDNPCITPPWPDALFAWTDEHDNVVVAHMDVSERPENWVPWPTVAPARYDERDENWDSTVDFFGLARDMELDVTPGAWNAPHEVAWERVQWVAEFFVWLGGATTTTQGPIIRWRFAIYEDGAPADLTWAVAGMDWDLPSVVPRTFSETVGVDSPPDWAVASLVPVVALNLLNCNNVDLVEYEPATRAERRRLERTGVRPSVIHVFPAGRRSPGAKGQPFGVAHHGVRGHFARYGPAFGRGLLFGRYAGRFYVHSHVRGSHEHGQIEQSYELHPEKDDG